MKSIYFATSNEWKFKNASEYFNEKGITIKQLPLQLPESRSEEVEVIAKEKADYAYSEIKQPLFVIDTAYYILGLNGFPKTYVKFAEKYIGAEGILKLLEGNPNRNWEVHNVICFKDNIKIHLIHGIIRGTTTTKLKQDNINKVSELDRIFIPQGYTKTYSEFSKEDQADYDRKIWKPSVFDEFIQWLESV